MGRVLNRRSDEMSARLAAGLAAYALGVALEDVFCPTRGGADASAARQLAMYLAHVGFAMSMARVGLAFGRDRSTVAHACRQVEDERDDAKYDSWLETLENALREAPPPASCPRAVSLRGADAAA